MSAILGDLKKSKKTIAFFAVLVAVLSCTVVLMGALAADSPSPMMSVSTSSTKTDTINDRPHLTWKTVKELAEGRLSYPDIRDSYYYKDIGSGLYIVSFPIEDAQGFSLIASSTSPNAAPMLVKLRCEPAALSLELNAENLGIIMDLYNNSSSHQEINKLFYNEIPVPQNAKTYGNIIYLTGRAPDEIIQDYSNMLLNNGWELTDALGMKRFYKKTINGEEIIISVLCQQEGGPQNTDILTVIRFNLEPLPAKKDDLEQDQQDVRALVEAFGKTLQKVSLSAPKDVVGTSIEENYSGYVTPELLQKWQADPQSGPSKLGSNSVYVFALPPRYNYAFQTGFEEVEEILKGNPLWPSSLSDKNTETGETQGKGIVFKFDSYIEQDGSTLSIEPSGTMKPSPELLEEARKNKESKKIRTGLFSTELDIKQEADTV